MSTAIFRLAAAVRLPLRVCSTYSLPNCTVNSDVLHVAVVPLQHLAHAQQFGEGAGQSLPYCRRAWP